MSAFIYGILLAFGLIVPLGVQNIFVFNQGVTQNKWVHSIPSILTAFLCDALLILGAIMGVSMLALSVPGVKTGIYLVGLVFLTYMGWVTWNAKPASESERKPLSAIKQIAFAASVSLLNPHALIDTVGVIGTNSLNFVGQDKWLFTIACLLVSFAWFLGLSLAGHYTKRIDGSGKALAVLNKFSALIIWSVAIYIAIQLMV